MSFASRMCRALRGCILLCLLLSGLAGAVPAAAFKNYQLCVQYQLTELAWSDSAKVQGAVMSGRELRQLLKKRAEEAQQSSGRTAAHRYAWCYSDNYLVILWEGGDFTALNMGQKTVPTSTIKWFTDQDGRRWSVRRGWKFCY